MKTSQVLDQYLLKTRVYRIFPETNWAKTQNLTHTHTHTNINKHAAKLLAKEFVKTILVKSLIFSFIKVCTCLREINTHTHTHLEPLMLLLVKCYDIKTVLSTLQV